MNAIKELVSDLCSASAEYYPFDRCQSIKQIIRDFFKDKLVLEEITEEKARSEKEVVGQWDASGISEALSRNYQVVTYDPEAQGWGVDGDSE